MFRHWLRFHTDPGGGGAPPAAEPAAPAAEPPAAPVAPAAPAAPSWQGPSQEEWQQMTSFQQALIEALNEPDEPAVPGVPAAAVDPQIEALVEAKAKELLEAQVGPYLPMMDAYAKEKGEALVKSELTKLSQGDPASGVQGLGEFDITEATLRAQLFFQQGVPAEQALRAAAQQQLEFEQRHAAAVLARQTQQMQNRIDAPQEPGVSAAVTEGQSAMEQFPHARDKYEAAAMRWEASRRQPQTPVG